MAFNAGLNSVCGSVDVLGAVQAGMLTEATLTERVEQYLVAHFRLGAYDSPDLVEVSCCWLFSLCRAHLCLLSPLVVYVPRAG